MRRAIVLLSCVSLSACVTPHPSTAPAVSPWEQRVTQLQHAAAWQLDGRAAAAVGGQGWQASLNWRQSGATAEVHISGPFGLGALVLTQGPDGVSLNGALPSDAVFAQLQERLGFELPIDDLRYWLLGVPDPDAAFDLKKNDQDRAQQLIQAGWSVDFDRYIPDNGDVLPTRLVLTREGVRVRIAIDHWGGVVL
jgi:outer membrane lipoprotein LolB